jgi:hypothetical protein
MADIINLRSQRKKKARAQAESVAAQNRVIFGRSKADKQSDQLNQSLNAQKLEGHRLSDQAASPADPSHPDD